MNEYIVLDQVGGTVLRGSRLSPGDARRGRVGQRRGRLGRSRTARSRFWIWTFKTSRVPSRAEALAAKVYMEGVGGEGAQRVCAGVGADLRWRGEGVESMLAVERQNAAPLPPTPIHDHIIESYV